MKKVILGVLLLTSLAYASFISSTGSGGGAWGDITGNIGDQSDLATELSSKVADTGDETIAGTKTFSSAPICSALTASRLMRTDGSKVLSSSQWSEGATNGELIYQGSYKGSASAPLIQLISGTDSGINISDNAFNRVQFVTDGIIAGEFTGAPSLILYDGGGTTNGISIRALGTQATIFGTHGTGADSLNFWAVGTTGDFILRDSSGNQMAALQSQGNVGPNPRHGYLTGYSSIDATGDQQDVINWTRFGALGVGGPTNLTGLNALTVRPRPDVTIPGTTTANATTTITGSSTAFQEDVGIGDQIALSSAASTFATVTAQASATSMTVGNALGNGTSQTIVRRQAPLRVLDRNGNNVFYITPDGAHAIGPSSSSVTHTLNGNLSGGSVLPVVIAPSSVVTLADAANVTIDPTLGNTFQLTAGGNRTLLKPTTCRDGQEIILRHKASGSDRTLILTTGSAGAFRFGTDITSLAATTSGTTDYLKFMCNGTDNRWDVVSVVRGY